MMLTASLFCHDGVVKTVMGEALVAVDSGVAQGRVFVAPEREHRCVHPLRVEDLQADQQMKIFDRQARDGEVRTAPDAASTGDGLP